MISVIPQINNSNVIINDYKYRQKVEIIPINKNENIIVVNTNNNIEL